MILLLRAANFFQLYVGRPALLYVAARRRPRGHATSVDALSAQLGVGAV